MQNARHTPDLRFHALTSLKPRRSTACARYDLDHPPTDTSGEPEISRFRRLVEPDPPANFRWVYSYGGTEDHLLDAERDRVADVFPDEPAITAAGWSSQDASDLLAVLGPPLVGIPANRIPQFLRRQRGRRFSQWQREADTARAARRHRTRPGGRSGGNTAQPPAGPRHRTPTAPN